MDRDTCIPMGARTPKDSSLERLQERNRRKREPSPQMNSSGLKPLDESSVVIETPNAEDVESRDS